MNLKSLLKSLKLTESTISMILGAIVIVVVGVLLINYFKSQGEGETIPSINIEDMNLPTTHIVSEGEELWSISEKYYNTGYNWIYIAEENNLTEPYTIEVGQKLTIPAVEQDLATNEAATSSPTSVPEKAEEAPLSTNETYIVNRGDTLWSIAEKAYGTGYEWVSIAKANNIEAPYQIETDQTISIPEVQAKTDVASGDMLAESSEDNQKAISQSTYTVQKGDHLWGIAVRTYGDGYRWIDIAKENNLSNPNLIHPGNVLSLPR